MSLLLHYSWLANENVLTIPKICVFFFYATVPKLALVSKSANVPYPLSYTISSSMRPQTVLILKEMQQYLHLCQRQHESGSIRLMDSYFSLDSECPDNSHLIERPTASSHFSLNKAPF